MMTLTPIEVNEQVKTEPRNKQIDPQKQKDLMHIALKIAAIDGYDEDLRIKSSNGISLRDTDLVGLVQHCLTPMRNTKGLNEFIELLYRAGVEPDLISNSQVRKMLETRISKPKYKTDYGEPVLEQDLEPPHVREPKIEPKVEQKTTPLKKKKLKRLKKEAPIKTENHAMTLRKRKNAKRDTKVNKRTTLWDSYDSD